MLQQNGSVFVCFVLHGFDRRKYEDEILIMFFGKLKSSYGFFGTGQWSCRIGI